MTVVYRGSTFLSCIYIVGVFTTPPSMSTVHRIIHISINIMWWGEREMRGRISIQQKLWYALSTVTYDFYYGIWGDVVRAGCRRGRIEAESQDPRLPFFVASIVNQMRRGGWSRLDSPLSSYKTAKGGKFVVGFGSPDFHPVVLFFYWWLRFSGI